MIYLDEFLRRFTEREALEDGKVAELADHYQAKVERTLKKLCSFLKENIVVCATTCKLLYYYN